MQRPTTLSRSRPEELKKTVLKKFRMFFRTLARKTKNFLYFLKNNNFWYFPKKSWPTLNPKPEKQKTTHPEKFSYIFRKKIFPPKFFDILE